MLNTRIKALQKNPNEDEQTQIGLLDTLIAAQALSVGLTVVTNNTREFKRVPGLRVADWTKG